jgi:hypothetical protein
MGLEYQGLNESIILKGILKIAWKGKDWIDLPQNREELVGTCEHCNEYLGPIQSVKALG